MIKISLKMLCESYLIRLLPSPIMVIGQASAQTQQCRKVCWERQKDITPVRRAQADSQDLPNHQVDFDIMFGWLGGRMGAV